MDIAENLNFKRENGYLLHRGQNKLKVKNIDRKISRKQKIQG